MPMAGFAGQDNAMTVEELSAVVRAGRLCFVLHDKARIGACFPDLVCEEFAPASLPPRPGLPSRVRMHVASTWRCRHSPARQCIRRALTSASTWACCRAPLRSMSCQRSSMGPASSMGFGSCGLTPVTRRFWER